MGRRLSVHQMAVLVILVLLMLVGSQLWGDEPLPVGSPTAVVPTGAATTATGSLPTLAAPTPTLAQQNPLPTPTWTLVPVFEFEVEYARVERVVDGDTVLLVGGERLRYIGIDTPETWTEPVECYAEEAKERNRQLVEGQRVALVRDVSERDRFGRLLRYVYLEDGTFVNEVLLREGYATAVTFPPDVQFSRYLRAAEREAREAGRGLWGERCVP